VSTIGSIEAITRCENHTRNQENWRQTVVLREALESSRSSRSPTHHEAILFSMQATSEDEDLAFKLFEMLAIVVVGRTLPPSYSISRHTPGHFSMAAPNRCEMSASDWPSSSDPHQIEGARHGLQNSQCNICNVSETGRRLAPTS
jgi:hypothetical protein